MRCHICNSVLEKPQWSTKHNDWEPCGVCQEVIDNVFEDLLEEEEDVTDYEQEIFLEIQALENSS
jgi:tRNA U54 and U55 pseudouridine synthase Pus10